MELTAGELAASVADVLGCEPSTVTVVARRRNVQTSTWPSEIVDCRLGDDRRLRLLLKHGPGDARNAHGHPVGPAYEALVYETVLAPAGLAHPFLGSVHRSGSPSMCLVLEYLDHGWWRMNLAEDLRAIVRVAAWLGKFHRTATARAGALAGALNVYDAEYYEGWAQRSVRYVPALSDRFGWFKWVCRGFGRLGTELASGPLTVVHGEFYPHNVLVHDGHVTGRWTGSGPRWAPARSTSPRSPRAGVRS